MNLPKLSQEYTLKYSEAFRLQVGYDLKVEFKGYYDIVCSMADVHPEEEFDGIATVQTFNLFGLALFPKQVGEIKPWKNPHDGNLKI